MSALVELQRGVQAWVLGESEAVAARIAGSRAGSAEQRLAIYGDAIRLRFLEVLGEEFPGVRGLVGDDAFERLARDYTAAHPSHHPSIRWFGRELARFAGETAPWSAQPVVAEMAAFEWAKSELLDEADSAVVDLREVAAIEPERWSEMRPRPVPAMREVALRFNVPPIWSALDRGEPPPAIERGAAVRHWLLWRKGLAIHWRSVEDDEARALDLCATGATFGDLCEALCATHGDAQAPLRAATLLKQWISDEMLRSV